MAKKLALNSTCYGLTVKIARSGEIGTITGFAQHQRSKSKQFFVEFTDALGSAGERWFYEDEIEIA